MRLTVDNADADISLVTYNDGLNYGRFDAPDLEVYPYSAFFPRAEFVRLLADIYDKCNVELKRDDEITGEVSELAAAGWPSLADLLSRSDLAVETIETFFDRDTFHAFGLYQSNADLVINSTDSVHLDADNVIISGRCFRRRVA